MEISKIDKNFAIEETAGGANERYCIPHPLFTLKGVFYEEESACFVRMPNAVAEKVNEGVHVLSKQTSGGRLCFETDADSFKIEVEYPALGLMQHMPLTGSSGFSLFEITENGENHIKNLMPVPTNSHGFTLEIALPQGKMRKYILYFPLYNDVKSLAISLNKGAKVLPFEPYRNELPIVYYGSSITQGGCSSRPDTCYMALISKWNNIDYINLGFSGSARGETEMVDYLTTLPCSLFVCDYDHNAPSAEHLRNTHYALYERYRKVCPNTPILFLTKPDITGDKAGEERLKIVKNTYKKAIRNGDKNVYFLSGKSFYGKSARWNFAVDGCHPTDFGFYQMAKKIYKKMIEIDERFGVTKGETVKK